MQLNDRNITELTEALYYFKIDELKNICVRYQLPTQGTKLVLIERIGVFITTGKVIAQKVIPSISRAKQDDCRVLESHALMLYGLYKNDAQTRAFFKKLIGEYFHFTAFGIDWLNERWMMGNPPTYAEFALFWQQEYMFRQKSKVAPKKEWTYINFVQQFLAKNPAASKEQVTRAWKTERQLYTDKVEKLLKNKIIL
jgi:hypothetical protein